MAGWIIWFILSGILIIAEMVTLTFYLLWLGIGALVGGLIALVVPNLWIQIVGAALVSIILTLFTKPLLHRIRSEKRYDDSVESIVGKIGIVTKNITEDSYGIVKISGETWSASASAPIEVGEKIVVLQRKNTILIVGRKES